MRRIVVLSLAVLAAAGAAFWLIASAPAQKPSARAPDRPVPVVVAEAVRKEMPVEISTIGRVQTIASVAVRSRIDGVIAEVKAADGQEVKAGDVLFTFDGRALEAAILQAQATLTRDRAQLENAKRDVERLRPLSQRDFVSRQQFDQTQTNATMLAATVQADEAQLKSAEVQLSYATIRAPIDGRLGTINFKLGNSIKANDTTPLVTLNQIRPIYVSFSVPQANFAAIQEAMAKGRLVVEVAVPGDDRGALQGALAYLENAIDPTTNTLSLKATFENGDSRLWPGQFVNATLVLGIEADAVVVPAEAVQAGQNASFVFALKDDSTVEARPVTVDRTIGEEAVIAKGVAAGDKVVVNGQLRLDNGTKVTIRPANEAQPQQQGRAG
jgi:membrane fusion protein, multidrug efflux system